MQAALQINKVPLDAIHRHLGAKMVPFAGYDMPVQYDKGIIAEHLHTRQSAGLFDVSHMGAIFVHGEAIALGLEKLIPVDIQEMAMGQTKYALLLNAKGGIVDDLLISRLPQGYLLVVNAGTKHTDLAYLQAELSPHIRFEPRFDKVLFALQGPKAKDVMGRLCPEAAKLSFMTINDFHLLGHHAFISRTGYTGEDGFEIILDNEAAEDVFECFLAQPEVTPVGLGARDSLRLEAGLCLYGHDMDASTSPAEAALNWSIGKRRRLEGQFAGATRVLTELKDGPVRKRLAFLPQSKAIAREGATIHLTTGDEVGVVTSGTHSPCLNQPIAMGFVKTSATDQPLQVNVRGQLYDLTPQKLPFVPHNYYRG